MLEKLQRLSDLCTETVGGSFQLLHQDSGTFKVMFNRRVVQPTKEEVKDKYKVEEFELMLDHAIAHIERKRIPATSAYSNKPFTLFKY